MTINSHLHRSAYGGGAPLLSNTWAAGPGWLDKLGQAALAGHQVGKQNEG